jgi:cell division transport system ATP-binding protein
MLRLDNVAMRYAGRVEVLYELNLSLAGGELVYLMGPTGAGKSSLLRLLGLLQMPCRGELMRFRRNVAVSDGRGRTRDHRPRNCCSATSRPATSMSSARAG